MSSAPVVSEPPSKPPYRCQRSFRQLRVPSPFLVRLLRRGATAEAVSGQLEAAAPDAADEPSFGLGSLSASLLRGASVRNHEISCNCATKVE